MILNVLGKYEDKIDADVKITIYHPNGFAVFGQKYFKAIGLYVF